jgi:hypothetical protein
VLQVICEVVKSGPAEQSRAHHGRIFQISNMISHDSTLATNTLVRKLRMKLFGRMSLRALPARSSAPSRGSELWYTTPVKVIVSIVLYSIHFQGRVLAPFGGAGEGDGDTFGDDYVDVPETVEIALEELFQGLQDKVGLIFTLPNCHFSHLK